MGSPKISKTLVIRSLAETQSKLYGCSPEKLRSIAGIKVPMVGKRLLKRSTGMPIAVIRNETRYRNRNP